MLKKTKLISLTLLTTALVYGTNGDTLIGVGAKSRAMGGTGIAIGYGGETILNNPATISQTTTSQLTIGTTLFMPTIEASMMGTPLSESDYNLAVIPSLSYVTPINSNWTVGITVAGTGGMGVDYKNNNNMNMQTEIQLMSIAIPLAYKYNNFTFAIAPIMQYGSLKIGYTDMSGNILDPDASTDTNFGYSLGANYSFNNLYLGATYKSAIEMSYGTQLSTATTGLLPNPMEDKLEQPQEIGLGVGYKMNNHRFEFNYKFLDWENAKGYDTFGWENQQVYSFGYAYETQNWALRTGYNYATHPLKEQTTAGTGDVINLFNILGFPATAEQHYTLGGSYKITEAINLDMAFIHSPTTTTKMRTNLGMPNAGTTSSVEHTENSLSLQLVWDL